MNQILAKIWLFLTNLGINTNIKAKENFADNHIHDISRLFDVLSIILFTTSQTMCDYYF